MYIFEILIGIVLLSYGAYILTEGASAVARKLKVSDFLIGLTIVAVGTSLPELVVSVTSAVNGSDDIALGNVVGSNVFNVFVILGLTALIKPLKFENVNVKRDIPLYLVVAILFFVVASDKLIGLGGENSISRIEGVVMLLLYVVFILYMIRKSRNISADNDDTAKKPKEIKLWRSTLMIIGGLLGLVVGSELFLGGSIEVAHLFGVSDAVIGIVLVAVGTSLPELATSFVAALRGNNEIALGNILGSNMANILLILGLSATITPLSLGGINYVDLSLVIVSALALLLAAFTFKKKKLDRIEGAIFLSVYIAYVLMLLN